MAACDISADSVFLRWTCLRVLVMLIWSSGSAVLGGSSPAKVVTGGNLTARVGEDVTFRCEAHKTAKITIVEWTRCDQGGTLRKVLVFMTSGSQLSLNETHKGRVTMTGYHDGSFTLRSVRKEDFGAYCCKLNVYPDGVLKEEVYLSEGQRKKERSTQSSQTTQTPPGIFGLPPQIVYTLGGVACAILLVVVVTTVIICKKRRPSVQDYVNVSVHHSRSLPGQGDDGEEEEAEDAEEEIDYLNAPMHPDP